MYYLYTCTGVQVPLRARATASNTRTSIQMLWAAPMPHSCLNFSVLALMLRSRLDFTILERDIGAPNVGFMMSLAEQSRRTASAVVMWTRSESMTPCMPAVIIPYC